MPDPRLGSEGRARSAVARVGRDAGTSSTHPADFDASDRYRLPIFAHLYDELGDPARASRCRELAALDRRLTADDKTPELAFGLGERFQDLPFHDPSRRTEFFALGEDAGFSEEMWAYGNSPLATLPEL